MEYTINVDLEAPDVGGGSTDCQSALHAELGPTSTSPSMPWGAGAAVIGQCTARPPATGMTAMARDTRCSR